MKKALALILALALCMALFAGCNSDTGNNDQNNNQQQSNQDNQSNNNSSEQQGSQTQGEPAAEQKELTFSYNQKLASWDPIVFNMTAQSYCGDLMYSALVFYDPKEPDGVTPNVAIAWEELTDAEGWLITIRDDVKFSNGEILGADDVAFTLEQYSVSPYRATNYGMIDHCEVVDATHVRVIFKEANNYFIPLLADVYPVEKDYYEQVGSEGWSEKPLFYGPYVMESLDESTGNVTFKKNPDYFGTPGVMETIYYRVIVDQSTAMIALEKGDINYYNLTGNQYAMFKDNKDVDTYFTKTPIFAYLTFNTEVAPTNDPIFRKAIAYALDRESYAITVNGDYGYTYVDTFWSDIWGEDPAPNAVRYEYNIEKAKELLAQGGYQTPYDLGIIAISATYSDLGVIIQQCLSDVGINCELSTAEGSTWIVDLIMGNYTVEYMNGNNLGDDPVGGLLSAFATDSINGLNLPRYSNPQVDEWLLKARSTKDENEKRELLSKALTQIQEDCPVVPVYVADAIRGVTAGLVLPEEMNAGHMYIERWYWAK